MCYYDGSRTGVYVIRVSLQDSRPEPATGPGSPAAIAGSPYRVRVRPAPPDPYATRASGAGVSEAVAGRPARFAVRVRDRFLNAASLAASRGVVSVVLTPPGLPPPGLEVTDCGDGECRVVYEAPPASGVYELSVVLDYTAASGGRQHIYNSPFRVFFRPGEVDPGRCWVTGRGLVAGGVGLPCRAVMHAADALGNHALSGGLRWHVRVRQPARPGQILGPAPADGEAGYCGGDEVEARVSDWGSGVYGCEFVPAVPGRHRVEVRLEGQLVGGRAWFPAVHELPEWQSDEARPAPRSPTSGHGSDCSQPRPHQQLPL